MSRIFLALIKSDLAWVHMARNGLIDQSYMPHDKLRIPPDPTDTENKKTIKRIKSCQVWFALLTAFGATCNSKIWKLALGNPNGS